MQKCQLFVQESHCYAEILWRKKHKMSISALWLPFKKKSGTKKGLSGPERYWCFLCTSKMTAHNFSVRIFFQREFCFWKLHYSNKMHKNNYYILLIINKTEKKEFISMTTRYVDSRLNQKINSDFRLIQNWSWLMTGFRLLPDRPQTSQKRFCKTTALHW